MNGTLSIVFTGLCALVGGGDAGPAEVLLLDAPAVGEARGIALPDHAPTLVVSLSDLANAETSAPTRVVAGRSGPEGDVEQLGLWDLSDADVRVRVEGATGAGVRLYRAPEGATAWPEPPSDPDDPEGWRDMRYVADMQALTGDGRVDPALLAPRPDTRAGLVSARIRLEDGTLEGALPGQAGHRRDRFAFAGGRHQALTDAVRWTLPTGGAGVAIDVVPRDGGPARRLLLAPSTRPHRLFVSNLPAENGPAHEGHGAGDTDVAAHHFGVYYDLLLRQPTARPLPERVSRAAARHGAGLVEPFFCPPALFTRP